MHHRIPFRKVNVVANALSKKSSDPRSEARIAPLKELRGFKAIQNVGTSRNLMARFQVKLTLEEKIVRSQPKDSESRKLAKEVRYKKRFDYVFREDGA